MNSFLNAPNGFPTQYLATNDMPQEESPLTGLGREMENLRNLISRLEMLADRMAGVGSVPIGGADKIAATPPQSVTGQLRSQHREMGVLTSRADAAIFRIETAF